MPTLSAIFRYPVKALGAESLTRSPLVAGETMPGDRLHALLHAASRPELDADGWTRCTTFLRGAAVPQLMACTVHGSGTALTFQHPARAPLTVDPGTAAGEAALIAWLAPLVPEGLPRPTALHRAARGLTDSRRRTVTLLSDASLAALSAHMGLRLDRARFRGNLWVEGLRAWEEHSWAGREFTLGTARLRVHEPLERCSAILANPATGRRDADVLGVLRRDYGHENFGAKCEVISDGDIALGDMLRLD